MGYAIAMGSCICCGKVFGFNPHTVPSTSAVTGTKEPVCLECMLMANSKRVEAGLPAFTWDANAYSPIDEREL